MDLGLLFSLALGFIIGAIWSSKNSGRIIAETIKSINKNRKI